MSAISVDDLRAQVARVAELRITDTQAGLAKKITAELLDEEERKLLELLEGAGLENFKCEHGMVSRYFRSSVKIPREPGDLLKLKVFLEQRGETDLVFTPNSAKLNSYFKEALEEAKRLGQDDFEIPGVEGVTLTPILSFRKV